jgi:hypothetical protein
MSASDERRRSEQTRGSAERASAGAPQAAPVADPLERLASDMGNRAFSALAREGAGILPDGRAHPEVESAIAAGRGTGAPLDARGLKPELRAEFADVRVHADSHADTLARSVSARAFTTGSDLWFASGEYRPGTDEGDRLLAHELAHVVQQRGAPSTGPLMVSQPGDALETQADAASGDLLA